MYVSLCNKQLNDNLLNNAFEMTHVITTCPYFVFCGALQVATDSSELRNTKFVGVLQLIID